jgi:hypothetical protein
MAILDGEGFIRFVPKYNAFPGPNSLNRVDCSPGFVLSIIQTHAMRWCYTITLIVDRDIATPRVMELLTLFIRYVLWNIITLFAKFAVVLDCNTILSMMIWSKCKSAIP